MPTIDRRRFVLAAGVVPIGLAMPALALTPPTGWRAGLILPWDQVRPGVWVTSGDVPGGNVLVATAGGRAAVIDSKFASVAGALVRDARAHAGDPGAPLTLINTHHHGDHTSGNATFHAAGATMVAHLAAAARIAGQVDRYRASAASAVDDARKIDPQNLDLLAEAKAQVPLADTIKPSDAVPAVGVGDRAQVNIPPITIELSHHGSGHTDNDIVVHLPEQDVIHTGDLVFNGLHPFFDPSAGVTARGWIKSLNAVEVLCTDDTVVVPGHGPVGGIDAVRAQRAYLEQLIEAVQAAQAAGETKEATAAKTFGFMGGLGFEGIRSRAIEAVWDELAG